MQPCRIQNVINQNENAMDYNAAEQVRGCDKANTTLFMVKDYNYCNVVL